uniref:Uncharacterized protein n=1 Tax=Staphylococcus phage HS05 TaxID=3056399 RepID=A0AA50ACR8_9VIRU|nr:MAG: hypothetical protein [Staphylococcus phage HS05]
MFYGTSLVLVPLFLCYNKYMKWSFLKCTQINLRALHGGFFVADINVSRKYVIIK